MRIFESTNLTTEQKEHIFRLWNQEYPGKLKYQDLSGFENYLNELTDQKHFLLTDDANKISGWSFSFIRHNEKWFAMILDKKIHRLGYGTMLLDKLKEQEIKLNGWVIDHDMDKKENGERYVSPLDFYLKNGFVVLPDIRLELTKISAVKIQWTK